MAVYYNEYDAGAAAWLRELIRRGLIADGVVDERSILDVQPDDILAFTQCHFFAGIGGWSYALRLAGWPDDKPVWTGSPPCQPFSSAGQQKGKDDERHLAPHFAALVAAVRPPVLFGEQVASSAVFGPSANLPEQGDGKPPVWAWIDDLFGRLEDAHYACGAVDLPAAGVGAPHIRQRTFFGAVRLAEGRVGDTPHLYGGSGTPLGGLGGAERPQHSEARQGHGEAAGIAGSVGRVADTASSRHQPRKGDAGIRLADLGAGSTAQQRGSVCPPYYASASDAPDSPWRDADWLFCRDGKWRPVEPSTFPLAHGLPARVVRLRGYGNAIVPQAAAQFIEGFSAVTGI